MASPTMKDVAQEAGVSLGTVSKVMNSIPVGEEYRRKVVKAAEKLGYQVNPYARALRAGKSNCIAMIVPEVRHPFFASLVDELTASLTKRGYWSELMTTNHDPESVQKCMSLVRQNRVDGIIALSYNPEIAIEDDFPFVSIDRYWSAKVPCVASDNYGGGVMAAERLSMLGCRNLLFLRTGSSVPGETDKRGAGFEAYCRMKNIPFRSFIITDEDAPEAFRSFLAEHYTEEGGFEFDGIFCNTDFLAVIIREMLKKLGTRVPEDVQIIGFDGIRDYVSGSYICSTIVQPVRQIAETAVSLLLDREKGPRPMIVNLPVVYAAGGTTKE